MNDRKERDADTFHLNFYFWGLRLFCGKRCLSEPVEITMLPGLEVSQETFIFGKLRIAGIEYKGFEGYFGKLGI